MNALPTDLILAGAGSGITINSSGRRGNSGGAHS